MREIKFRGVTKKGTTVVGDLMPIRIFDGGISAWEITTIATPEKRSRTYRVEKFAQFCGVDSEGEEVFEGDILLDDFEQEHVAEIYDRPQFLKGLRLK